MVRFVDVRFASSSLRRVMSYPRDRYTSTPAPWAGFNFRWPRRPARRIAQVTGVTSRQGGCCECSTCPRMLQGRLNLPWMMRTAQRVQQSSSRIPSRSPAARFMVTITMSYRRETRLLTRRTPWVILSADVFGSLGPYTNPHASLFTANADFVLL